MARHVELKLGAARLADPAQLQQLARYGVGQDTTFSDAERALAYLREREFGRRAFIDPEEVRRLARGGGMSLPQLPEGPKACRYPSIFRTSAFGSSTPHLDDLPHMVQLVSEAAAFRPGERCKTREPYPFNAPPFPTVPAQIAAALAHGRKATQPTSVAPAPRLPTPERLQLDWVDYLLPWQFLRKRRQHAQRHEQRKAAFQRAIEAHAHASAEFDQASATFAEAASVHRRLSARVAAFEAQRAALSDAWISSERDWYIQRQRDIEAWENLRLLYSTAETSGAVERYFAACLATVPAPRWSPNKIELRYDRETGILLIDYQLPDFGSHTIEKTRSLKQRTKHVAAAQREARDFAETAPYFLVLRLLWEIAHVDETACVRLACCNAYVVHDDAATGQSRTDVVMSVAAKLEDLLAIRLERIDPESCFRSLKGVAAPKLGELVPVTPVIHFDRTDRRFIDGKDVLSSVGGQNLATMDWQDFEHLIRELFEKEFAAGGAEVRVTQASRDRGVDAVVFDPDPIRGGKYVIQAKRYAHTVDVAAVRDLYGTMQAEGANKGILVTTSNYGGDSYEFAKGKPLTLLNGANLLSLLQKHGYGLRIDLNEAKRMLKLDA